MKTSCTILILITLIKASVAQDALEIVKKADEKMQGNSSQSEMEMTLVRQTWQRSLTFKNWTLGTEYALTLITAPAKESGQSFLKLKNDMWNWNPMVNKIIKLPPSMMSQGWMGSDYTNDDVLKESSIVVDYTHKIIGIENLTGSDCWKIELTPNEKAAVVWGKIIMWISKQDYMQLKIEYYDEDMVLIKTHTGSEIKNMGGRTIPTRFEIIPADKPFQKTIVVIKSILWDKDIPVSFFSQQNMKKIK